ncbi:MAG: aromatic-ring-hydroxylating dioxygenase subunit beta [Burkholderiaceae bacterium]
MSDDMPVPMIERVRRFHADYADALNQERYAQWPDFFTEDACDYRIVSRENHDLNLPAPLMGCYSHGMVKDRVAMLVKGTLTFRRQYLRHFIDNVCIDPQADGSVRGRANLLVMQSDLEGNSSIYMVGRYEDCFVDTPAGLRLRERLVIIDSFSIDNMLAVPL